MSKSVLSLHLTNCFSISYGDEMAHLRDRVVVAERRRGVKKVEKKILNNSILWKQEIRKEMKKAG